jgi:hypothetical protein
MLLIIPHFDKDVGPPPRYRLVEPDEDIQFHAFDIDLDETDLLV